MSLPSKLNEILNDLAKQDWIKALSVNSEIYVVGGTVRDAYINKPMKDIDLIVDGLSYKGIKNILHRFGKLDLVGESFSVIKFRPHGHVGEDFDIAVPRTDSKVGEGHKGIAVNTDDVSIEEDLKRRDFTINSMAVNVITKEVIDPFDGQKDLDDGIIRATDMRAFADDPLRILRAVQFSARFDFEIAEDTKSLMKQNASSIGEITGERLLGEFQKILLKKGNTQVAIDLLHDTDIDLALFDKKISGFDRDFKDLDPLSFYYTLGLLGEVDPMHFYIKRLKGDAKMAKALGVLSTLVDEWASVKNDEEEMKMLVMSSYAKSPEIVESVVMPERALSVIEDIEKGDLPSGVKSLSLTGNDLIRELGIKGRELGLVLEKLLRDAMMERYNWKDKNKSLEYLRKL